MSRHIVRFHLTHRLRNHLRRLPLALLLACVVLFSPTAVSAGTVPSGFVDEVVKTGFLDPTQVRFSPDGRVFVAEKSGRILVFDDLNDSTPTVFANLSTNVYNFWDRGLLGLALHPDFPRTPEVFVMYTYDAAIGGVAPRWGTPGVLSDPCPTPPGPTADGCVVSGRISKLIAAGDVMTGPEQVLVEDWCQQYPSHSVGALEFGSDGALYATGGDGASFNFVDYGQDGNPINPCGDPPGGVGATLTPPTAEGGALRSQDIRTSGDPVSLDGSVIRIDPETGEAMPTNPRAFDQDPNGRRIVAHGFRNPFRFTIRPGTNELWVGDVGWNTREEITRIQDPVSTVTNAGWPCYEGAPREGGYDSVNVLICENLYAAGPSAVRAPHFSYVHGQPAVPGDSCSNGSSSISGLAFYTGGTYPSEYNGALFFGDYSRSCIWVMLAGAGGVPDPTTTRVFDLGAAGPVELRIGPGGDLFYVGFQDDTIRRIRFPGANQAPTARIIADRASGAVPLAVNFDGRTSSDPEGTPLTYAWDLDGDGAFDDSTSPNPSWTYTVSNTVNVRLRVTDTGGSSATDLFVVTAGSGNAPPTPVIQTPSASLRWRVGDTVPFSGTATDPEEGTLGAASLSWSLVMQHCPGTCHAHPIQDFVGVSGGSFVAPDHEFPSHLELKLTATDSLGAQSTTTLRLDPQTVQLQFASSPSGLELVVGGVAGTTPFSRQAIVGSTNSISAPTPQTLGTFQYDFASWSDGGAQSHNIVATSSPATYTASFTAVEPPPGAGLVAAYGFDEGNGSTTSDQSGNGNNGALSNVVWAGAGLARFGNALTFNGASSLVSVADAASLRLTTGMTLEAWVRPTVLGDWKTVVFKERPGYYAYALYANDGAGRPSGHVFTSANFDVEGTAALPLATWSHLAVTYDGSVLAYFVNGVQVATTLASGAIVGSLEPVTIGGNAVWTEWFQGQIDEVRIYNRPLSEAAIQADMNRPVTNPDTTAPTAPTSLTATGGLSSAQLSWPASTDAVGVTRYNVHRGTSAGFTPTAGNRIAQPTGTSYTDPVAAGTYYYRVTAEDAAGNISGPSPEASATVGDSSPPTAPSGLSAVGAIGRATLSWTAAGDNVGVVRYNVHRGTTAGFTPALANRIAQPTSPGYTDFTSAGSYFYKVTAEDGAGNVGPASNEAAATITADTSPPSTPTGLTANVAGGTVTLNWIAANDNVAVSRYNLHRSTTAGFTPTTGNRIAQPTSPGHTDAGLATGTYYYKVTAEDAAGNISTPSNQATATIGDATPPSAPGNLTANVVGATVNLSWTAASDNIGVVRYNLHRGTTSDFTPTTSNRIAQPTGLTHSDTGLAPGSYFYKATAEDAAGNIGPVSNTATATLADTSPPTTPTNLSANGGAGQATLTWTAASDNVAVTRYNLHRSTTSGFTPTTGNRIAQPTGTSHTDTSLAAGTYYYKLTAEDAAGNTSSPSNEATATVTTPPPTGLVGAYGFDEGTGTTTADQSGTNNPGTLSGATWTTAGRYGNALNFDGVNDLLTITDSNSLDLTTGMTLEAWVRPTALGGPWRTAVFKERPGGLVYALYAHGTNGSKVPAGEIFNGATRISAAPNTLTVNTWTHLATTYNGTTLILFVNGVQVAQFATTGPISTSTGALRVGGNTIWSEWFQGQIDEVRVYNRALSAAQIQTDMNSPITPPDAIAPSAPGTLSATGALGQISLAWGAATDNVAVTRYNLHRSPSAGFTPTAGNRIAQPTGTSYSDSGLAAGAYYYKVTAEDAAGNVGPTSNEASAVAAADTTPPTVSVTAPSAGATLSATVTVTATASDNGSVAGVQFKLDGANLGAEDTTAPYSVSWDTSAAPNGPHGLTAVARDAAGNATTSASVPVTVQNTGPTGLVGAWALDEGSGATVVDQSGRGNVGTHANGTWVTGGKYNSALSFNGANTWVSVPDSTSLDLTTGMTVEAWVRPSVTGGWRTGVVKEQPGNLAWGIYTSNAAGRPSAEVFVAGATRAIEAPTGLPSGVWAHLAATYDGTTLRLYVNGSQAAQLAISGTILTSNSPLRMGGNGVWGEWFSGLVDEVRVYNRALSAAEIQGDMSRSVTPDVTPPNVAATTPLAGAAGVNVGTSATARFNEAMNAGSVTASTFELRDSSNALVPASVSYNGATDTATLTPQAALQYGATYTVIVKGGSGGVTDTAGNALAANHAWTFSTEASPPPILLVNTTSNRFGAYLGEILRNEGLNAFTTIDVSFLSPALLAQFDTVVLGETPLSPAQVTALSSWVTGGGNLVAMRPDKQLAGLLGLADAGATLTNAYLQVNTSSQPGAGIVGSTIQFHSSADRYSLNGATAVATLFSSATTSTTNPAVTLRSVGSSGGQAAAFTYDLARSVVYTRQGNPAWQSQDRDATGGIRSNDLFYGARAGDVQPDWLDTNKIAIPQADEQQRLLLNLLTLMMRDRMPLPRFWYLPRGEKAVVVMSGDDHSPTQAPGGTASHFDRYKALSPPGCSVVAWDCVRSSSYVYPNATLTSAQATGYQTDGFEVALHPLVSQCPTTALSAEELGAVFDNQLAQFRAKYTGLTPQLSSRTHCVYWPDWATNAKVELERGIRMDANYYHYAGPWIGAKPGFMNGGGFPMRFADLDGTTIDVYQANTNVTDESGQNIATTIAALLDNAVGAPGYYGAFGANMHTDSAAPHAGAEAIVTAAQARSVPVISYRQLLGWVDGRNGSTIRGLSWNAGTFSFVTTVGSGATGLQTMLPVQGPAGTLTGITRAGSPVTYSVQTIKGVQYALFDAATASYQATYS